MHKLRYSLARDVWNVCTVDLHQKQMGFAYVDAIKIVEANLDMSGLEFLALGGGMYVIWGQGKCQGYMSIKEVGLETSAVNSGNGQ